ncbi:MAG: type II secretion system protein GspG [Candidatus Sumerlaeota bacterium]|nr:type II secretion system protein GspG [Candidatus Sumerlaeota bacterium]
MNATALLHPSLAALAAHPVLPRLGFVSVELAFLACAVALAIRVFRIRSARLRALLWLLVLAKPILGLALGAPAPLIQFERPKPAPAASGAQAPVLDPNSPKARQLELDRAMRAAAEAQEGFYDPKAVRPAGAAAPSNPSTLSTSSMRQWLLSPAGALESSWLAGMCALAGLTLVDLMRLRRLRRSASEPAPRLRAQYASLAAAMGIKRPPRFLVSAALDSPALSGILRPVVLMPHWLAEESDPDRLRWLLRHELTHWKLRDPLGLAIRRAAEALFFFHPAVWWAGRRWEEAMELACDRALLVADSDPRQYAEQLYRVLERQQRQRRLPLTGGLFATRTQIGRRIEALLANPLSTPARLGVLSAIGLAFAAAIALPIGLGFTQSPAPESPAAPAAAPLPAILGAVPLTPDNSLGLSDEMREKLKQTGDAFAQVVVAIGAYWLANDRNPATPEDLIAPVKYLDAIPQDPFGAGPIRIAFDSPEPKKTTIASVGPDGQWDEGLKMDLNSWRGDLCVTLDPLTGVWQYDVPQRLPPYLSPGQATRDEPHAILYGPEDRLPEDMIAGRTSYTRSSLRSLHTAMEAYRVDYNDYPSRMATLTTPIAYLTSFAPDPFALPSPAAPLAPGADPDPWRLKMRYAPDYSNLMIYGVGPDRADEGGMADYDPTNGTISGGDIVRRIELTDFLSVQDKDLQRKIDQQTAELHTVATALETWWQQHQALPQNLAEIVGLETGLMEVPADLFGTEGRPVSYALGQDGATIYSWGPDGKDDGGQPVHGRYAAGQIPPGDIAVPVSQQKLQELTQGKQESVKSMLKALLDLTARDGRDNALIHYVEASVVAPDFVNFSANRDLITETLRQGWSEKSATLLPIAAAWQPAFQKIRDGAAVGYARGIGWSQGPATPVPNFLAAQTAAKMLCFEGRYLESQGKPAEALNNCLTALTMGRDYGSPDNTLISGLISVAVESIAVQQVRRLVAGGQLDRAGLQVALDQLAIVARTQPSILDAVNGEKSCVQWAIDNFRKGPAQAMAAFGTNMDNTEEKKEIEQAAANVDRLDADHKKMYQAATDYLAKPYWERDEAAYVQQLKAILDPSPVKKMLNLPNYQEADTRYRVAQSKIDEALLAAALELFKLDNGQYPDSLQGLMPKYIKDPLVDPFCGQPYRYILSRDAQGRPSSYTLYSLGPDSADNQNQVLYDPTNGTTSAGDL